MSNSEPVAEGTVIMAEEQFAGRGQQQNSWHAEPGKNLTFSILLNPTFLPVAQQFDLNRAISVGLHNALFPLLGQGLKTKWPNDVYYHNQKLGGVLIENILQGGAIKHSVVGIGINVNQDNFPPQLNGATSVKQILQRDYDLSALLSEICRHIEAAYVLLRDGAADVLRNKYVSNLYRLNELHHFRSNNEVFEGMITGVSNEGKLLVKKEENVLTFDLKEIEYINN